MILDEVAELLSCTRYDHYLAAPCIFHQDSSPSLMIYPDFYICLSCGKKGKTSQLLRQLQGNPPFQQEPIARAHPGLWRSLNIDDLDLDTITYDAHNRLKGNLDNAYYLKTRGIFSQITPLHIGFIDGWFIFPVYNDQHRVQGLVARAGIANQEIYKKRYIVPPHQPAMLYVPDWKLTKEAKQLYLVFGIIDAITLNMIGIPAITGTAGHNLPVELFNDIRKRLTIIPDGDGADDKTARGLCPQLSWRGKLSRLPYPEGTKDANEIYCRYGKDKLIDWIKEIE